LVFQLYFH
jgi:hypothetical protein